MDKNVIKMKPFFIRMFCRHDYINGIMTVYDIKGEKRRALVCLKCGKRNYLD